MSATSTSKQPMLADRPFLRVFDLSNYLNDGFDPSNGGNALPIVDQINGDGIILDDIALISRGTAYHVNIYLSTSNQVFRKGAGVNHGDADLVLRVGCTGTPYEMNHAAMPKLLTPVPRVGTEAKNHALYVPRGFALWAAIDTNLTAISDGPNILIQGGVY